LDRIMAITPTGEVFAEVPGQGLADYRALAAEVSV
jgi:hypothetical protein